MKSTKTFKALGVTKPVLDAIRAQKFDKPTEIQARTIPLILSGRDVIGGSKTGSGKTLAFSCGIIKKVIPHKGVQAVVLVPTRELAEQVGNAIIKFSKFKRMSVVKVYGGVSINPQIEHLRRADVVVATPGRLLDHIDRRTVRLNAVKTLVLDEADLMLDMGFLRDVEKIIRETPKRRQTLLFSATVSDDIYHLEKKHMHNPEKISVEQFVDASKLRQVYIDVLSQEKFSLLVHLLKEERSGLVMVFCNTRRNTDFVAKNLKANNVQCCAIHGGLTQSKRQQILQDFHRGKTYALICTDVAARGLDIQDVSHIYNYDVCKDAKQYIHRIGRTARAGKEGKAITLLSDRDHDNFSKVSRLNRDIEHIEMPEIPSAQIVYRPTGRTPTDRRPGRFMGRRNGSGGGGRGGQRPRILRRQSNAARPRRSNASR
ncbi:DEAD/DEAH box helicase [Candidatus Woesearchaeota archaeon]|jgi:superfamily II DNA/RNA helicase|nr:DEAD/DEAH box helicase [Candidatus Woesearchaeota archaeon]MBT4114103.1 DEAD/DEAH box helicase [Candidatus Woesearchaeota archaeon]MBT4248314.1 DEAD/DEAH box helicase [Candidatus Woesearchaeota archaeon]